MKRVFDVALALLLLVALSPLMLLTALLIKLTSRGPVLYWSERIGRDNVRYQMPKFRTMRLGAPEVATHLLADPKQYFTPFGGFIRGFSVDELPQLFSILADDMSFVGPRPALFNQDDLVELRTRAGVHKLTPGLTGWAQVKGRDDLAIPEKVEYDAYYLRNRSLALDLKIMAATCWKVLRREGVAR